ncbi:monovalent cation/H+ antiporter complex subunit F [Brevundimonas sp. EAKA]|uniref:monovalent cation/H+ antiporter complex subunit F n=1 Tax=Brevundimonas sp. EAKA TaxID=1495854 RepID=UPI0009DFC322|nr:monovalent cation/H+ antiporter complex subunit F [Brevundimonas sp. EAKA]
MMSTVATIFAALLILVTAVALMRVGRGPTTADRMLGLQLLGTSLTALALLLGVALDRPRLWDIALVFAVLASPTAAVFIASMRLRTRSTESDSA